MKKVREKKTRSKLIGLLVGIFVLSVTIPAMAEAPPEVWFTRHANDQTNLIDQGGGLFQQECFNVGAPNECCIEVLDPLGEERAARLADWLSDHGITQRLTQVLATHKGRTVQTVVAVAAQAGLSGDSDLNSGDGVQQIPSNALECDAGFESSGASRVPTIDALQALPQGSVVLVGAHSGTTYRIMDALGIDTSDSDDFPRSSSGKVSGFNNLWKITMNPDGTAKFKQYIVLDLFLERTN